VLEAIRRELRERFVRVAEHFIPRIDLETGEVDMPGPNHRQIHVCYPLAWLYVTEFPGNSYYRSDEALAACFATAENRLAHQTPRGGFDNEDAKEQGNEWQSYFLVRTAEVLGPEIAGPERWEHWADCVARYVDCHGSRQFFYSAPNHDCWKCAGIYTAGVVYDRPEWRELADFQMSQLLRYQLGPGYWDENRHHGPSMSYNHTMSTPLFLFWKMTGREDVRAALERLLDFMIRYAPPDGSPGGALDGRMHARPGRINSAMTLTAAGRRMNQLAWENWVLPAIGAHRPVAGDAGSLSAWQLDLYRFAQDGPAEPIGPETDGHLVEEHEGNFHALARRQGPWHTVLSGVFSDIPKECDNVYRLSRQSRIDLWHEKTGLLIGGGSVHRSCERQVANLFLDTDYFADVDFGRVSGRFEDTVRATFYPRFITVASEGERSRLELSFAHAQGTFTLRPRSGSEFEVAFEMRSVKLRRAFACLPLVVWSGAAVKVDGEALGQEPADLTPVKRLVEVTASRRGPAWEVEVPAGVEVRLDAPFTPIFAHRRTVRRMKEDEYYEVAVLAAEVNLEGDALPGPFVVRVR
jgi:hypothetical protein